ncbi:ATP-dependent Clp protease ATP-binding subunit [Gammaproteobacteria bacterium]|nr:ATP-dependent Clp protease ATP-binding subunit [Gammaproteobacteria bacterium]
MLCKQLEIVLKQSFNLAYEHGKSMVEPSHLLQALMGQSDVKKTLKKININAKQIHQHLANHMVSKKIVALDDIEPSPTVQRIIKRTFYQCQSSQASQITTIQILVAVLLENDPDVDQTIQHFAINKSQMIQNLRIQPSQLPPLEVDELDTETNQKSILETYTVNLNHLVTKGSINQIFSRTEEMHQIIQVIHHKIKSNALIIGEPGVGKTALVEGLAWNIVKKNAPEGLLKYEVLRLDIADLVAGTKYRGEFEQRLRSLVLEAQCQENVILFIDEIHNIVGAGKTNDSTLDASNILKPLLTDENIRVLGATTPSEYTACLKMENAFTRRFQTLSVREPDFDETYTILMGVKKQFEAYHRIKYKSKIIRKIIMLTNQFMKSRHQPDKAIDMMDSIGAKKQLEKKQTMEVNETDVTKMIAHFTDIPHDRITEQASSQLVNLKQQLSKTLVGQTDCIEKLTQQMQLSQVGLNDHNKPTSFLLVGPTGVGKTECCLQLAKCCEIPVVRFDMSEYKEAHTVAKWIGSPPGYIGSERGGLLTEKIQQYPQALLLIDEIEKAHPDVLNILLQVMDYGTLKDSQGTAIDFRQVTIMMTSNVGSDAFERRNVGFAKQIPDQQVSRCVDKAFIAEFRSRIDQILIFKPLPQKALYQIIDQQLSHLKQQLAVKKINLHVNLQVKQYLFDQAKRVNLGARPIKKLIDQWIKQPIAVDMLNGQLTRDGKAEFIYKQERPTLIACKASTKSLEIA